MRTHDLDNLRGAGVLSMLSLTTQGARGFQTSTNAHPHSWIMSTAMMMHRSVLIHPLEPRLANLVTSGPSVQSLPHAVEACVTNSIASGASHIAVRISPLSFGFIVEDDGRGISASVLPRLANRQSAVALGGDFFADLAATGCLTVASKATSAFDTHRVTLAGGRAISCGLAAQQRSTQGTIVHVTDLFHSTPVRRMQMTHARYHPLVACTCLM